MKAIDYAEKFLPIAKSMSVNDPDMAIKIKELKLLVSTMIKNLQEEALLIVDQRSKNPTDSVLFGVLREQNLKYKAIVKIVNSASMVPLLSLDGFEINIKRLIGVDI